VNDSTVTEIAVRLTDLSPAASGLHMPAYRAESLKHEALHRSGLRFRQLLGTTRVQR